MTNNQMQNNLPAITMLRGIACLAVCFLHFTGTTESEFLIKTGRYGFYGVPLFFAISGFVIPYSMYKSSYQLKGYFSFLFRRVVRLHPPYLAALLGVLLLSVIAQLSPFSTSERLPLFSFSTLSHFFLITDFTSAKWMNPVFWTLAQELQFYMLCGLFYPLMVHKKEWVKIGMFLVAGLVSFCIEDDRFVIYYLIYFLPGLIIFWYYTKQLPVIFLIASVLLLAVLGFMKFGVIAPVCAFIFLIFVLLVKVKWKPLVFLGTISYSLYLIHTPLGTDGIINFIQNYNLSSEAKIWLMFGVLPIVIFGSWVFYRWFEKPFIQLSKKIKYKPLK